MNVEKIKKILLEHDFMPTAAERAANLIHNHTVAENSFYEQIEEYKSKTLQSLSAIQEEVFRAKKMFPKNFTNQHEGYAVILEEMDELWTEIKKNQICYDIPAQRKEAIQAAAMLVRFIVELTNTEAE